MHCSYWRFWLWEGALNASHKTPSLAKNWLREGAQISTCKRKTATQWGRPIFVNLHRKLRWLRGLAMISSCSFRQPPRDCEFGTISATI